MKFLLFTVLIGSIAFMMTTIIRSTIKQTERDGCSAAADREEIRSGGSTSYLLVDGRCYVRHVETWHTKATPWREVQP